MVHTRSDLHTGSNHSEADKEEEHTAQEQHTPRGWGITPLHHVGGAGGGRSIGVRGALSQLNWTQTRMHVHTFVGLQAVKAISTSDLRSDVSVHVVFFMSSSISRLFYEH